MTDNPLPENDPTDLTVTLPSGAWARLHVPPVFKAKHQKAVLRALDPADEGRELAMMMDVLDGVLTVLIQEWTVLGDDGEVLPIPSADLNSLGELEIADSEFLLALPCVATVAKQFTDGRKAAAASPDDWDDPSSPTGPSSAAGPRSRVEGKASSGRKATRGKTSANTSGSRTASAGPRSK